MNADLQKCREHYESLFPADRHRPTAAFLLTAIQIAESLDASALTLASVVCKLRRWDFPDNEQPLWDELQAALSRVMQLEEE